ncbi:S-methyl-5'-thioinosine phosphorylase [Solemya velum gill symbiont]|nr:S-methyl-5'-thioinosine phosphorylase [Solemya velum gill symbiont]
MAFTQLQKTKAESDQMKLGVIGGSGLSHFEELEVMSREIVRTPYGEPSAPVVHGKINGTEFCFIPRHGAGHRLPPHRINYRANIWAMKEIGVEAVIALATVGGITKGPETLITPDQVIDYTWGREHTFFDGLNGNVTHADFTSPFCDELRQRLIDAARGAGLDIVETGTYAATQGPRLESAAEIRRLEQDGNDIIGMTVMPEAGLARELGLCYAAIATVVNWAAGKSDEEITQSVIDRHLGKGLADYMAVLSALNA